MRARTAHLARGATRRGALRKEKNKTKQNAQSISNVPFFCGRFRPARPPADLPAVAATRSLMVFSSGKRKVRPGAAGSDVRVNTAQGVISSEGRRGGEKNKINQQSSIHFQ